MRWHLLVRAGLASHLAANPRWTRPMRWVAVLVAACAAIVTAGPAHGQSTQAALTDSARVLADSARRLDSLAISARTPPSERWRGSAPVRLAAAALYRRAGDRQREFDLLLQMWPRHPVRDSSGFYVRSALAIGRELEDARMEGEAAVILASYHAVGLQHDSVIHYRRLAARVAREQGDAWPEGRRTTYHLAYTYRQLGQLDSAEVYYHQAVARARSGGQRTEELLAVGDLGNVHVQRGRLDSAFAYYHAALAGFRAIGHRAYEATWLNNLAGAHLDSGRPDSGLVYFRQSLAITREGRFAAMEPGLLNNIGAALMKLGRVDSAAHYFALGANESRRVRDRTEEGLALGNLAGALNALGRPDSALASARLSIELLRGTVRRAFVAATLDELGLIHLAAGRLDSALAAYREGLQIARDVGASGREAVLLRNLGDLHARIGPRADLARAVAYYDSAWAVRTWMTASAGADQRRVSFAELGTELIERWALAWLAQADEVGGERSALAALAVAERGRAQALLELLRRGHARDSISPTATTATQLATSAIDAGGALDREGADIVATARATGAPVLAFLATKDTMITWLVLPTGQVVLGRAAVSRDSAGRLVAAARAELDTDDPAGRGMSLLDDEAIVAAPARVARDRARAPARRRGPPLQTALAALAGLALPPTLGASLPATGELVVVAHGPLALAPLAALPAGGSGARLGTRYALRHAPSFATLRAVEGAGAAREAEAGAPRSRAGGRAFVVGNPAMPGVRSPRGRVVHLPALPAAGREGQWVAGEFGGTQLTGRAATERAVLDGVTGASVIHLATHAFAFSSDARVLDSFIALAPDSAAGGAGADGRLTVGEVLDGLPALGAELVVLSACQTGLGNLKQAEGTVGLQRAFLARGARSVLVSLWNVSDEATELLMRRFYTHWLRDPDQPGKAEALRRAQQDVRAVPRFADPRYWAAFQLVGAK